MMNYAVKKLRDYGYLWHLAGSELELLRPGDQVFQEALRRYQEFMPISYAKAGLQRLHRLPVIDGELGPASMLLLDEPRCPIPDIMPPTGADLRDLDSDVARAIERWQQPEEAQGRGGWRAGCHRDLQEQYNLQATHIVLTHYDESRAPRLWMDNRERIITHVRKNAATFGVWMPEVPDKGDADVAVSWRRSSSWAGLAQLVQPNVCGPQLFQYMAVGFAPSIETLIVLHAHEQGHNLGFPHVRQGTGVMGPTLDRRWWETLFSPADASWSRAIQYYGGRIEIPTKPKPGPNPPPPPGDWKTLIEFAEGQYRLQEKQGGGGGGWGPV